ncbi:hypothetical protein GCM10011521_21310 [Arenimonas soli]|uniref:Uncharacterized protein n=1 Tax=Arenimonas soli TaxID=2269504 RepID=A0ABQ1HN76_9GAMM|nr:hypothetical protein GCM10011521_21310 [Arenimonas soli]
MSAPDFLDFVDLFVSWRFYAGLLTTCLACLAVFLFIPSEPVAIVVAVPLGVIGLVLSWRWQQRADDKMVD